MVNNLNPKQIKTVEIIFKDYFKDKGLSTVIDYVTRVYARGNWLLIETLDKTKVYSLNNINAYYISAMDIYDEDG